MSETKTYVFGNEGENNGLMSLIGSLLQKQGCDPNMVMAMMNNRNCGFGGEGGWFMWIIFLFFLMGWGGNGNGFGFNRCNGNGMGDAALANLINNDNGRDLLMQAIQGNGNAINQLASTMNCSIGQIQSAIGNLMTQVQGVGNQVGMSSRDIINAIQAGNCNIASKIADCCCENRLAICQQTNTLEKSLNTINVGQEKGFANIGFETQKQTCDIINAIKDNTAQVIAGQNAAEMRELQREITERDRRINEQATVISEARQTNMFGKMISDAISPLANGLCGLKSDIDAMKCKLPNTVTLPYSEATAVPNCMAYPYMFGCGFNNWG